MRDIGQIIAISRGPHMADYSLDVARIDAPRFAANIEAACRQMWQARSAIAGRLSPEAGGRLDLHLSVAPKSPETTQVREAS